MTETLIETSKKKHKPLIPVKVKRKPTPWGKLQQQVTVAYDRAAHQALMAAPILDWLFTKTVNKSYFNTNVEASVEPLTFQMLKDALEDLK